MKRCGSCSSLRAPFGVDCSARSCRHHIPMTQEELEFGEWYDTECTLDKAEIEKAKKECDHFHVPEYL